MLSPNNQKYREGVQVPFLEKMLKENQKTIEQLENNFDETTGKQLERLQVIEKISKAKLSIIELTKAKLSIIELTKAIEYSKKNGIF